MGEMGGERDRERGGEMEIARAYLYVCLFTKQNQ